MQPQPKISLSKILITSSIKTNKIANAKTSSKSRFFNNSSHKNNSSYNKNEHIL